MRILFVYTNVDVRGANCGEQPYMQYGIASLSALLKKHGHECDLLLVEKADDMTAVDEALDRYSPGIVGHTAVATQFPHIVRIARHIRSRRPELFQVCGGPHASLAPEEALSGSGLDAVCIGEGEYPMLELVEALSRGAPRTDIENLWFRTPDGGIVKNGVRPLIEDLDSLPFIDRSLASRYVDLEHYPHSILTTRGCHFDCSYCCNHAFRKLAKGRYVRSRSVSGILSEIEHLRALSPSMRYLYVEDETIGQDRRLWDALLPELRRTGLRFGTNYRIGTAPLGFLDRLREAGFERVNIGIESGNDWIRRSVLNRRYSDEAVRDTFARARKLGMHRRSYNLIGLPHETPERFEDTVRINREVGPDAATLNIFYPYPGTRLHAMCGELGLRLRRMPRGFVEREEPILELPGFPRERILECCASWKKEFGPRPPSLLSRIAAKVGRWTS